MEIPESSTISRFKLTNTSKELIYHFGGQQKVNQEYLMVGEIATGLIALDSATRLPASMSCRRHFILQSIKMLNSKLTAKENFDYNPQITFEK